ncbi:MAG: hypothetical protein DI535_18875 [Citrobacter freundii]|nr:MAG: hypothetical protein DI535_18875 [Citrobacter freundii]
MVGEESAIGTPLIEHPHVIEPACFANPLRMPFIRDLLYPQLKLWAIRPLRFDELFESALNGDKHSAILMCG